MDLAELNRRLAATEQIAREAGTLARTWFDQRDRLRIEAKGPQNLVSEADRAVEVLARADALEPASDLGRVARRDTPGRAGPIQELRILRRCSCAMRLILSSPEYAPMK